MRTYSIDNKENLKKIRHKYYLENKEDILYKNKKDRRDKVKKDKVRRDKVKRDKVRRNKNYPYQ